MRPTIYKSLYTTMLLLATGIYSSISYAVSCGPVITSDCTTTAGNTGYTFANTATLSIIDDVGATAGQSITIDSGATATLSFLNSQGVTGITSGADNTSMAIDTPSSITATFFANASAGNVSLSGDGILFMRGNNLYATTAIQGDATFLGGTGAITSAFQFGSVVAGTGNANVLLNSGTIGANYLHAESNSGNVVVNTGNTTVDLNNGNFYSVADGNGNVSVTLGNAPTTITNGGFYAQAFGVGDTSVTVGNGKLTANYLSSGVAGTNNTATLNIQGPAVITYDIGVSNTTTANVGFGTLITGLSPITSGTIFFSIISGRPLFANNITLGMGGLTVTGTIPGGFPIPYTGFTLRATDTLTFDFNNTIPTKPFLNFLAATNNTITFDTGSTIGVVNPPYVTQTIVLAQAPTGLTSAPGVNYLNNIPGFMLNWFPTNTQLLLNLIYTGSNITQKADRSNTIGIAEAISQMNLNTLSGELLDIFNSINDAARDTSNNDFNNALAATAPLVDNSVLSIWVQQAEVNKLLLRNTITAPISVNEQGVSSGDTTPACHRVWATALGSHLNQQLRNQIPGYRGNVGGVIFGGETMGETSYVGIAGDISTLRLDADVSPSTTHVNHYAVDVYGHREDILGPFFVDGILTGGYNHYRGSRNVDYGTVSIFPQAKYTGWQVDAFGRLGVNYETCLATITPLILAEYDFLSTSGYTETGAGTANQTINAANFNQFLMGAGLNLGQTWEGNEVIVQPNLYAAYLYALSNATMQLSSAFVGGGPAFVTTGATPPRSQYHLGAELALISLENWDTTLSYDAQIESEFLAQSGFIRWRYRW